MSLKERLAEVVRGMPEGAAVVLPVAWIRDQLDAGDAGNGVADLTVQDVAEELARAPSTVRGWLGSGELRGYRFRGREWRVTRQALAEFVAHQRDGGRADEPPSAGKVDLGAWRRVVGGGP